jgi:hypothetical protein
VRNLYDTPALFQLKAELVRRLNNLRTCAGATCEGADAATP